MTLLCSPLEKDLFWGDLQFKYQELKQQLSFGELCQLAIFLGREGEMLARQILPFCRFPALWCPESRYHEKQVLSSIVLLKSIFRKETALPKFPTPYFNALSLPQFKEGDATPAEAILFESRDMSVVFATKGDGIPLGSLRAGSIEVPAFGPQMHPLNDPSLFGIYRPESDAKWGAVFAQKDIWFEMLSSLDGLDIRFFGITVERPLSFVFYVKAELVRIGQETYFSKSLRSYFGESKSVCFEKQGSRLVLESVYPSQMQLIPLAGEGCFWNGDFLLSFMVSHHLGKSALRWHS